MGGRPGASPDADAQFCDDIATDGGLAACLGGSVVSCALWHTPPYESVTKATKGCLQIFSRPYFDLDAIRVPYRATPEEIERRKLDSLGRRNTDARFGRDRTRTYRHGGADPGNVVSVPQTYNQHRGAGGHTAAMPEKLAEFFIRACSPAGGVVIDPFAGSGTTTLAARRLGRRAGGLEIHQEFVNAAHGRLRRHVPDDTEVVIDIAP